MSDDAIAALNAANGVAYDVLQATIKAAYEVERAARLEAHRVYEESKKAREGGQ